MSTTRDFDVDTWFEGIPLMFNTGEAVRVLSFCLEPISLNSVFFEGKFVGDQPFADI